jgi:thiaminase/transcriptional activator TenA
MGTEDLLTRHAADWREATRHRFLDGVREGTLPAGAFDRWLIQDHLFVADLLVFQARLLARAPREDQAVLAGGLGALEAELSWFEEQAERLSLELDVPRYPTAAAYLELLRGLEDEPYPAGITALWALERAYLEAWRGAAPGGSGYEGFVEHWTTPEFADYVASLEKAAGSALKGIGEEERQRAEAAFVAVARLERDFWQMAFVGGER